MKLTTLTNTGKLIQRCLKNDRKAQSQLYHMYNKSMYNICLRMMGDQFEAEDALQNSFITIFTKLDTYSGEATIGAWIKRIVINHCINELRRKKAYISPIDDRTMYMEDEKENDREMKYSIENVQNAMQSLPDGYRMILGLYLFEGYDHKEIGEILNITESTSKSQYSRAKSKLRKIILSN